MKKLRTGSHLQPKKVDEVVVIAKAISGDDVTAQLGS